MRAFVTGAGGFLGKALCLRLLQLGYEVHGIARSRYPELEKSGVRMFQGDISDHKALLEAAQGCDLVFHVAAKAGIWGSYRDYYQSNVEGTKAVVQACETLGIRRLIYTSSPSVVFDGKDMCGADETVPYPHHFEAHYPHTKALAEQWLLGLNKPDLLVVALRPHLIWGIGDNHLIPRILHKASRRQLRIVGSGTNLVDCVTIDNAVAAHICAADTLLTNPSISGRAYFIANDEPHSLFAWINRFVTAAGFEEVRRKVPVFVAYAAGSILESVYKSLGIQAEPRMTRFLAAELGTSHYFNLNRAKTELGYLPKVSTEECFAQVFASSWWSDLLKNLKK